MSEDETDIEEEAPSASDHDDPDAERLEKLESRLADLKQDRKSNSKYAKGIALVTSMGFLVAGCILLGFQAGQYMQQRFGSDLYLVGGLLGGIAAAFFAAANLMKPFWGSDDS